MVKVKSKNVSSFVNRLKDFPQFNRLPDMGKPKSANIILILDQTYRITSTP